MINKAQTLQRLMQGLRRLQSLKTKKAALGSFFVRLKLLNYNVNTFAHHFTIRLMQAVCKLKCQRILTTR